MEDFFMFTNYTDEEKLAVIAVVKGIILSHGGFSDQEIDYVRNKIESENFPDYSEKFLEFEKKYPSEAKMYEAFAEVERENVREELIDLALNLAAASGIIEPSEVDVINHMCEIWGYEHKIEDYDPSDYIDEEE
jgi:uncharacterized tellurite resistance protein B-like protein